MAAAKKVLLIDPNDFHYRLIKKHIAQIKPRIRLIRCRTIKRATRLAAHHRFDLTLAEMGAHLGWIDTLKIKSPDLPIVILSSETDREQIVDAMKRGIADFIPKNQASLASLGSKINHLLKSKQSPPITHTTEMNHFNDALSSLKSLTAMIDRPARQLAGSSRKGFHRIEKEVDDFMGRLKSMMGS